MNLSILLLFIDGFGIGKEGHNNPVSAFPLLFDICSRAIPLDATLGIPGVPQSATGQTTLFTGVNASETIGRHEEGFPGSALRQLIIQKNLFSMLREKKRRVTFANAYFVAQSTDIHLIRHKSVTTLMTWHALGRLRTVSDLLQNDACYQDLTREMLRERQYTGPLVSPETSAEHLFRLAMLHDLTLFEFFLTDRAGHKMNRDYTMDVLGRLELFLQTLHRLNRLTMTPLTIVLTSDHGNIEAADHRHHTLNPVPFYCTGSQAAQLTAQPLHSLQDVTPALMQLFD